ncbi:IS66 family transposase [Pseudomonas fluorescens group sp.]|uniref:Transposase n=2 Tax=Pseudomonas fluorescens TaxID=294 RepID=C3K8Q3_PSEFS|nr:MULTISPECIES: IS66 family transposase [Pseudomonas fluorescens group]MBZ6457549.1 IS66 family transposase [Pseudomonas fluorescens group sp.]MBZ6465033.1 IS66 family transposase [Pseudomonas fluorescens group sp.]MBZ6471671.1 IS66 family transposase [Pseudomonas fluorescens group sp.]WQD74715.1 IS66 family transposase [Pseudomonas marginalis]CAI2796724.1 Putative transposase [Pseudomonas fluorescens SBW25]
MTLHPNLDQLNPEQLRALAAQLIQRVETMDKQITHHKSVNEKLAHEIALLKRFKFAKRSEQLSPDQASLLDDLIDTDIAAIEAELEALQPAPVEAKVRQQPKRAPLPPQFPRTLIHHEPDNSHCQCGCALKRIGEDASEKLDYTPGVFTVERHIRGKWACEQCETLIQAPVPAHVIDKGVPTAGLLAHIMVAKFADHLPLYRQEKIFGRAGLPIARSTLAQWVGQTGVQLQPLVEAMREAVLAQRVVHADETPVQMLAPGEKKTHRAYVWAYCTTPFSALKAVVYDFSPSRAGEHARNFLGTWNGKLVCDGFAGYKAGFEGGITEIGCMAHARRKFFDLHVANKSQLAEQALHSIGGLYEVERKAKEMSDEDRWRLRQEMAIPIAEKLHEWMLAKRELVPEGSATAKALDYSLKRWVALTRYLNDGAVPIDNNRVENTIRPWALGRSNWLFAGSLRSGKRAAAIMSLIQSARMNGHDPFAYLKDVLTRLPTQRASAIDQLLPHQWAQGS